MKKIIVFFSFFISLISFGQTSPNLEGEYYFKNNQAMLYIFNKNEFLVLGYMTAVKGKIEIENNKLKFISDHPNSETLLYARKSSQKQIIFNQNAFRKHLYFANGYDHKNNILLNEIKKEEGYCRSYCYFLPLEKKADDFLFKVGEERNDLASFKINKNHDEFLLQYISADVETFFLIEAFSIEDNRLIYSDDIQKKDLNLTKEIGELINRINEIDLVFQEDKLYLNEDFDIILNKKIDLTEYRFNKLKNQYVKKIPSEKLNILYVFTKIQSELKPNQEFDVSLTNFFETRCLRTPKTILEEKEDEKRKKRQ